MSGANYLLAGFRSFTSVVTIAALVLGLFAFGQTSHAAINAQIPFEGYPKDSTGAALSGTYDMVFTLHDAAAAGATLWTGTHSAGNGNAVTVASGTFAVLLGSGAGNSLAGVDFNSASLYLEVAVEGETMSPRYRLGAAAYAFNADTLDGFDASDFALAGSSTVTNNFVSNTNFNATTTFASSTDFTGDTTFASTTFSQG